MDLSSLHLLCQRVTQGQILTSLCVNTESLSAWVSRLDSLRRHLCPYLIIQVGSAAAQMVTTSADHCELHSGLSETRGWRHGGSCPQFLHSQRWGLKQQYQHKMAPCSSCGVIQVPWSPDNDFIYIFKRVLSPIYKTHNYRLFFQ